MEPEVQRAICDYLALRKVFFFGYNNQPIYDPTRKAFRKLPKYTPKGIADILAAKSGKAIFSEVKRDKARMSPEQHEFARGVIAAGGEYHVARSIDDVQEFGL